MSRSVEQALLSLMPSHGSALPPQLVELSTSLLALSRHRASTLKAEEEVARTYACCHIACDRLKITLNLPPIESRPPIPPRIYKRLYAHLDNILPNATSSNRTPGRNRSTQNTPTSSRVLPSRVTPSKEKSLAQFRSDANTTPSKSAGKASASVAASGLHPWIQPTLRFMCRETGQPRLAPSMLAGAEIIMAPGGRRSNDKWIAANLTPLCGALYFFVAQQVQKLQTGEEFSRETYIPARKQILAMLVRARDEVPAKVLPDDEFWDGHQIVRAKEFDATVQEMTDRGWLDEDWFRGLSDVVARMDHKSADQGADGADEEPSVRPTARSADSMLQDKCDFFTDEKRKDYRIWKEDILRRIEQLERDAPERMDVDT